MIIVVPADHALRCPEDVGDAPADPVGQHAAEILADGERTQLIRRRVLTVQLARLVVRTGETDLAALDAGARAVRLASRLERDQLEW